MRTKSLLVLLAVGLAGCTAGPDYVRPDVRTNAGFHEAAALDARHVAAPAPALDTWWKGFGDPELVTIVDRVLAQNLDLAAS
ncbi:MAG: TolC family protein, partial [Luteibacter sp.]